MPLVSSFQILNYLYNQVQIGHAFNPKPHYNSSYLNGQKADPVRYANSISVIAEARNRAENSSKLSGTIMERAGQQMMG